nr:hypothetical protein HK105_008123 [Polyrhizophydium stewartii]
MRHTHQWSQQSPTRHTQHRSFSRCPSTAPAASTYGFAVPGRPAGSSVPHVFAFSPGAQDHSSPSQSSSSYMSMDTSDVSDMDLASPMNLSPWSSSSYPSTAAASVQGSAPRSLSMPAAPQDLSDLIPNMRPSRAYALAVHPLLQTPEERLACTATAEDEPRPSFSQNHPKPLTSVRSSEHSHSAFPLLAMHLDLSQPHPSVASEHQTRQLIPIPIVPSLCDAAVLASSQAAGSQPPHPNMLACQSQQQHQSQESSIIVKIDPQPPSHLIDPRPPSLFESVHSPAHLQLEPPIKRVRQDQDAQLALSLLRSESAPTVSPVLNPSNADPMIAFSLLPSLEELVCLTASGNGQAATAPALVSASSQPASSVNSLPSMLPLLETGNTLSIHTSCSPQPSSILIDARVSSAFAGQALPWDAGSQPCSGGIVTPPYPEIIPTHIIDEMLAPLPRSHPRSARADASQRRPPGAADPAHSFDENSTDALNDNVVDMVWAVFESGASQQAQQPHDVSQSIANLVAEMDLASIHALLKSIHRSLASEAASSVRFALLLNFKHMVLDAVLKIWPLEKLQTPLPTLHPMECVYMILNSTFVLSAADTDAISSLFGDDFQRAYTVFWYILLWINWKVHDPAQHDERYYEAYFSDFSRDERKRVMSSIGADILRFLDSHPEQMMQRVVESFDEIVPLLEGDHLLIFWKFYKRLQSNEGNLYAKLTQKQISRFLSYQHGISPSSSQTPGTPNMGFSSGPRSAVSIITDVEGWEALCAEILTYIAQQYEQSPQAGERTLCGGASSLLAASAAAVQSLAPHEITPADKIVCCSRNPAGCVISLLRSDCVALAEIGTSLLQSIVLHWGMFEVLQPFGLRALHDLARMHAQIEQQYGARLLALHSDLSLHPSLDIISSLEAWMAELGHSHIFYDPLSSLLARARQDCDTDDLLAECSDALAARPRVSIADASRILDFVDMWLEMHPTIPTREIGRAQLALSHPDRLFGETHLFAALQRTESDMEANAAAHIQFIASLFFVSDPPTSHWVFRPPTAIIDLWRCFAVLGITIELDELLRTGLQANTGKPESASQALFATLVADPAFGVLELLADTRFEDAPRVRAGVDGLAAGIVRSVAVTSRQSAMRISRWFMVAYLGTRRDLGTCNASCCAFEPIFDVIVDALCIQAELTEGSMEVYDSFWDELDNNDFVLFCGAVLVVARHVASTKADEGRAAYIRRIASVFEMHPRVASSMEERLALALGLFAADIQPPYSAVVANATLNLYGVCAFHALLVRAILETAAVPSLLEVLQTKTKVAVDLHRNTLLALNIVFEHSARPELHSLLANTASSHRTIAVVIQNGLNLASTVPREDTLHCFECALAVVRDVLRLTPDAVESAVRVLAGPGPKSGLASCMSALLTHAVLVQAVNETKDLIYKELKTPSGTADEEIRDREGIGNMLASAWAIAAMSIGSREFVSHLPHCRLVEALIAHTSILAFAPGSVPTNFGPIVAGTFFLGDIQQVVHGVLRVSQATPTAPAPPTPDSYQATGELLRARFRRNGVTRSLQRYAEQALACATALPEHAAPIRQSCASILGMLRRF